MIKGRTSKTSALLLRMGLLSSFCRAEYQQRDEEEESEQDDADGLPEPSAGQMCIRDRCGTADGDAYRFGKSVIRKTGSDGKLIDSNNSTNDFESLSLIHISRGLNM